MRPATSARIKTPPSIRILVVDDDASYLRLISLVLERYGHSVQTAINGEIAAELANEVDVAIVDMVLPGMCGLEIIPLLQWRNPSLTIFASSGCSHSDFRKDLEQLGVHVFLPKPFPAAWLVEQLARVPCLAAA